MAFLKKANAVVVHPRISTQNWSTVRTASGNGSNFTTQAKDILGGDIDSNKYLFTHCTIVASVDTEVVSGVKTGSKVVEGNKTIQRPYSDYYIKPQCSQFVNNNGDSWSREVLLASYRSFIGAHNFQEHVQIEEQSKGRIIDAVARDIGDSIYIDILVATDRKHAQLVQDIESGNLTTLSMGCTTEFTLCSQCGNLAVDETQLCDHIKYSKLNTFMDESGQKRVVAELCGHKDYSTNGGVNFIEASWVGVPAFTGAVMRNIITPESIPVQAKQVLNTVPTQWDNTQSLKAASYEMFRHAEDEEEVVEDTPAPPSSSFKDLEDEMYNSIKTRVQDRIKQELNNSNVNLPPADGPNDSIIKEGSKVKQAQTIYKVAMGTLVKTSQDHFDVVRGVSKVNESFGIYLPQSLYVAAIKLGSVRKYGSINEYRKALTKVATSNRFNAVSIRMLVRIGTLLSQWESFNHKQ